MAHVQLQGKIIIKGDIEAVTGLHIGGAAGELDIGGVDNPVLRNPLSREPYIPGSSLRGKMRSLLDRYLGNPLNKSIGRDVRVHESQTAGEYAGSPCCHIFGITPKNDFSNLMPTRLIVRDVHLSEDSREQLEAIDTDLPFTEVKTEIAMDRITSAASPRQHERVPAGSVFGPLEMVYSLYTRDDESDSDGIAREIKFFDTLLTGMELLEDDYLGGSGSRGSGKVRFSNLSVTFKSRKNYEDPELDTFSIGEDLEVDAFRQLDYRATILAAV